MTYPATPPPPDAQDWLMGGGTKSASFDGAPPITNKGQIVDLPPLVQKRDFDTGDPLYWPDGRPKMLMQVNIQTDQRDPSDPEDEGVRALYLEYRKAAAVRDAVRGSGAKRLEIGGTLSLTYTGDDHAARRGKGNPPKNYSATYTAPDPLAAVASPQDPPPPQPWQAPPAAPAPPVQAPAAPTPAAGVDPNLAAFLRSRGIDASGMDPATAAAIAKQIGG
ncbi:hypothetical protein [Streptomyces sp. NPDC048611]|uniref:hypothetical protein n=1 Tax=Streptomyces sp. NPDC048611 TaxID=3155635 RepID=UPI003425CB9D